MVKIAKYSYFFYFNYTAGNALRQSEISLVNCWGAIQKGMSKFIGCLAQVESLNQSGLTQQDNI
jgi:hypothetical protein